ncbi:DUF4998 domain-containing protein [Niabella ginsengisoli]|uniref:Discoidin domain-containing protein n=1 Tax=Niabella ginsengisoli TaxID=522298 RepID=A0ABS9SI15_9BACT|nr:DUF4998 domain-containing protein [Niabella ginsengisoli]MCH5598004.1 discoidin domain-containing protein [Niabella ginsengisoli]
MKRISLQSFTAIYVSCFGLLLLFVQSGCSKMNDTYKEFLGNGPIKYIGKPDSIISKPGNHRIQLSWVRPTDPKVKGAVVYWNNKADSSRVMLDANVDTIQLLLNNMAEGEYVFQVYSSDAEGNLSLGKEVVARIYGDSYTATLLSRPIDTAFYYGKDTLQLYWGGMPDTSIIGTEIIYHDRDNVLQKEFINDSTEANFLYNFNGGAVRYRTVYVPERKAIDTFYTAYDTLIVNKQVERTDLSKQAWTITASSFDTRSGSSYRPPANLLDNNLASYWVNSIAPQTEYPHWVAVDMGAVKNNIAGLLTIQRRENVNLVKTAEVYISEDGIDWQLKGTFTLSNTISAKDYLSLPEPVSTRYFMIKVINDYGNSKNVCLAEIGAFRYE